MSGKPKLKVFANGSAMLPRIDALRSHGPRRFIGWRWNEEKHGWEQSKTPEEVPYHHDYIKALKAGDLLPADKETAKLAGVAPPK